jgi:hypothetical protein
MQNVTLMETCRLKQRLPMEEEVILGTYLNNNLVYTTLKNPCKLHLLEGNTNIPTASQEGHA